jgi:hypothetical protein
MSDSFDIFGVKSPRSVSASVPRRLAIESIFFYKLKIKKEKIKMEDYLFHLIQEVYSLFFEGKGIFPVIPCKYFHCEAGKYATRNLGELSFL